MANLLQKPFGPLCRLAHRPDPKRLDHLTRAQVLERLFEQVDLPDVQTVVEIGCGDGWVAHALAERFPRVIGLDINPERIVPPTASNVTLTAATAEQPCIRHGSADLIVSIALLEHIPDPLATIRSLVPLLSERGRMLHVVPHWGWKVLQFAGFYPNIARKRTRSLLRGLAGLPKTKAVKYYAGRENNNPRRISRRVWYRKFYPRIHGEYDSHVEEILAWRPQSWIRIFEDAGLRVTQQIPMGIGSPYLFGISQYLRPVLKGRLQCATTFVLEPIAAQHAAVKSADTTPHVVRARAA
jgi:trans-aconitate methyltransferase